MNAELQPYTMTGTHVPATRADRDIVDGWAAMLPAVADLADRIANTDFVPKTLRNKPAAVAACMLTGREMGIGPMVALKVIHMVDGTPALAAEYKRGRALEAGHVIEYGETSTARCIVRGRRRDSVTWTTVTWTIEDARRAKLAGKPNWQNHPRRMLEARATGELCDLLFPDCTYGLATLEELEDGGDVRGVVSEEEPPKKAKRRTPAGTPLQAVATPVTQPAGPELPPLPGEEEPPPAKDGPSDEPGSITDGQLAAIWMHFQRFGFQRTKEDRESAHRITATIVGRELTGPAEEGSSSKNLSRAEATAVHETLAKFKDEAALSAYLELAKSREGDRAPGGGPPPAPDGGDGP